MIEEPAYKLHDKITYKGIPGVITYISKYTEQDMLDAATISDCEWVKTHPFIYTITYDTPQSYQSIISQRKFPDEPTKWNRMRVSITFEYPDFDNVKLM
jgi:hypothetical protein